MSDLASFDPAQTWALDDADDSEEKKVSKTRYEALYHLAQQQEAKIERLTNRGIEDMKFTIAEQAITRIESAVDSLIFAAPELVDERRQQLATIAIREVRAYRRGEG